MMELKVIGTGCPQCSELYENTLAAVQKLGVEAQVEKVEDLMEIVRLGVMAAPSLMINGRLALSGQVAQTSKIMALIQTQMSP